MLLHLIPFKKGIYCFPNKLSLTLALTLALLLIFNVTNAETTQYSFVFYNSENNKICTAWCDDVQSHLFCAPAHLMKGFWLKLNQSTQSRSSQDKTICQHSVTPAKPPESTGHPTCPALPHKNLSFFKKWFRRHILPSLENIQYFWTCSKGDFTEDSIAVLLPYMTSIWVLKKGYPKWLIPIALFQPALNIMGDYVGDWVQDGPQEMSYSRLPQSFPQFLNELVEDYFKMLALTFIFSQFDLMDPAQTLSNYQAGRIACFLAKPIRWPIQLVSYLSLYSLLNAEADELGDNVAQSIQIW